VQPGWCSLAGAAWLAQPRGLAGATWLVQLQSELAVLVHLRVQPVARVHLAHKTRVSNTAFRGGEYVRAFFFLVREVKRLWHICLRLSIFPKTTVQYAIHSLVVARPAFNFRPHVTGRARVGVALLSLYFVFGGFCFHRVHALGTPHPATSNICTLRPAPRWQIRPWLIQPLERLDRLELSIVDERSTTSVGTRTATVNRTAGSTTLRGRGCSRRPPGTGGQESACSGGLARTPTKARARKGSTRGGQHS
jgi:hypothetical protein